jgi:hypothetical protein
LDEASVAEQSLTQALETCRGKVEQQLQKRRSVARSFGLIGLGHYVVRRIRRGFLATFALSTEDLDPLEEQLPGLGQREMGLSTTLSQAPDSA